VLREQDHAMSSKQSMKENSIEIEKIASEKLFRVGVQDIGFDSKSCKTIAKDCPKSKKDVDDNFDISSIVNSICKYAQYSS
jgi:hypothetical protein